MTKKGEGRAITNQAPEGLTARPADILMTGFTIATYTIQVLSPDLVTHPGAGGSPYRWSESDKRVLANLPAMIESIEEDFTDLLPEGYSVKLEKAME